MFYIQLTSLRNKFPLSVFTFPLLGYSTRQACTSMATHANRAVPCSSSELKGKKDLDVGSQSNVVNNSIKTL